MLTYLHLAYHVIHPQTQSSWCQVFDEGHAHSLCQTGPMESPAPAPTSKLIILWHGKIMLHTIIC